MWNGDSFVLEVNFVSVKYVHNYKLYPANRNETISTNPTTSKATSERQNNCRNNIRHSSTSDWKQFNKMKLREGF